MRKNYLYALVTLIVIGLAAILRAQIKRCYAQPRVVEHYGYVTLQPTWTPIPPFITPRPSPTEWMTATITPTTDYIASGLPSPTATPTIDYAELAKTYLNTPTPYPTHPTPTPQPTSVDPLTQIIARELPPEWSPVPFQVVDSFYDSNTSNWLVNIIQNVTDLMNWVDADPIQFWRQVKSLQPEGTWFGNRYEWLLRDDFDGDQKPEWLVSVPAYSANKEIQSYPEQVVILFELTNGVYKPVAYQRPLSNGRSLHGYFAKVLLVQDLNQNGLKEIVLRSTTCGTACSEFIQIGEWDGKSWHNTFGESLPATGFTSYFMFVDKDSDGLVEITLNYTTYYKLDGRYPEREASDTYGWRNGHWVLLEEWRSPSADPYAIMRDVYSALELGKTEQAIEFGQPLLNNLQNSCGQIETYTGLEVMLAYTILNKLQAAQVILQKLDAYCSSSENVFLPAAHVYMQAYQRTNDAIASCSAMNRFVLKNGKPQIGLYRFFGNGYYLTYCPISPSWQ